MSATTGSPTSKSAPTSTPTTSGNAKSSKNISDLLKEQKEWEKAVVFDHEGKILGSTVQPVKEEVESYLKLFDNRDATIASGIKLLGEQFDVHRYHPPLIYGRRGDSSKGQGEGIAICKIERKATNTDLFCIITYTFPIISARAVPQLLKFCEENLESL